MTEDTKHNRNAVVGFGKFGDATWADLPDEYLTWMVGSFEAGRNPQTDERLQAAQDELNYREQHPEAVVTKAAKKKQAVRSSVVDGFVKAWSAASVMLTPRAIDDASLLLLDRYTEKAAEWTKPVGFCQWLVGFISHYRGDVMKAEDKEYLELNVDSHTTYSCVVWTNGAHLVIAAMQREKG